MPKEIRNLENGQWSVAKAWGYRNETILWTVGARLDRFGYLINPDSAVNAVMGAPRDLVSGPGIGPAPAEEARFGGGLSSISATSSKSGAGSRPRKPISLYCSTMNPFPKETPCPHPKVPPTASGRTRRSSHTWELRSWWPSALVGFIHFGWGHSRICGCGGREEWARAEPTTIPANQEMNFSVQSGRWPLPARARLTIARPAPPLTRACFPL